MSKQEKCECEHISHFGSLSPNGNPTHKYGVKYFERYMTTIKTKYGTFRVCKACAEDCLAEEGV